MYYSETVIREYPEGIEVIVPPKKSGLLNTFLMFWMLAWSYGEINIISKLVHGSERVPDAFLMFWTCAWSTGGFIAVLIWLWNLKGREIVWISEGQIKRYREYVFFSRTKVFESRYINNLRVTELDLSGPDMPRGTEFWGLSGGAISFDYGNSVGKFGLGLGDAEAGQLIDLIKSRFGQL